MAIALSQEPPGENIAPNGGYLKVVDGGVALFHWECMRWCCHTLEEALGESVWCPGCDKVFPSVWPPVEEKIREIAGLTV